MFTKRQLLDKAQQLIYIAEDIYANIEDDDFEEVKNLIAEITYQTNQLKEG